jgi:hypothetical protein
VFGNVASFNMFACRARPRRSRGLREIASPQEASALRGIAEDAP